MARSLLWLPALPVYFFTPEELREIFNAGPAPSPPAPSQTADAAATREEAASSAEETDNGPTDVPSSALVESQSNATPKEDGPFDFDTLQMALDRRMLVNRKEDKKMYRNWIQTKLRKR